MPALYLATGKTAGDELSSTYEGRHLSIEESYMTHPYHSADGFVDKGDPVLIGDEIVGVALDSAVAATDYITIDTEGIFFLNVHGCISDGTVDGAAHTLAPGDPIFIKRVPGTAAGSTTILSGQSDPQNYRRFGYLLGDVAASLEATNTPTLVAVKVHGATSQLTNSKNYGSYVGVFGDNLEIELSDQKTSGQLEASALGLFVRPIDAMAASGDRLHGIKIRLEDTLASTGGDLQGLRVQVHQNHQQNALTRLYGIYIGIALTSGASLAEAFGLSINMGGTPGYTPAMQALIQMIGDGTLATKQSWFKTEIGRGAGLKAEATNVTTKVYEIPIQIDNTVYAIPVIPWI